MYIQGGKVASKTYDDDSDRLMRALDDESSSESIEASPISSYQLVPVAFLASMTIKSTELYVQLYVDLWIVTPTLYLSLVWSARVRFIKRNEWK